MKNKKIISIFIALIFMSFICGFSFLNSKKENYDFNIDICDEKPDYEKIINNLSYDSLYKYKLKEVIVSNKIMEEKGFKFTTNNDSDYLLIFANKDNENVNIAIRVSDVSLRLSSSKKHSSCVLITDSKNSKKDLDFSSNSGIPKGSFTILELEREKVANK
ncbi:hypothetical protein [Peptoniphilus sp. DNF00840]|uniref:hypothetical protein n=1 Tax=Peptoniphilus sp. DNF00840 TaxID=1477000 RepID=UPI0007847D10|nr:hypothetical protein [Peptoniphilus sp. DNF00840]KXB68523.1 hypothetical protein HMPREF1864_01670 [Peptoniphilus sp. DNF00840]